MKSFLLIHTFPSQVKFEYRVSEVRNWFAKYDRWWQVITAHQDVRPRSLRGRIWSNGSNCKVWNMQLNYRNVLDRRYVQWKLKVIVKVTLWLHGAARTRRRFGRGFCMSNFAIWLSQCLWGISLLWSRQYEYRHPLCWVDWLYKPYFSWQVHWSWWSLWNAVLIWSMFSFTIFGENKKVLALISTSEAKY